jgi:sulfite reductase (ferredoxin)
VVHPEHGEGFTVLVGGGLGRNYAKENTFARLADPLAFVTYEDTESLIKAIIAAYRDLGDRTDRKRARLKYVLADAGLDAFRVEVETRWGRTLIDPVPVLPDFDADDHLGWRDSGQGTVELGIRVGAGRVADFDGGPRLRSALREIARRFAPTFYVTPNQDLIVAGLDDSDRGEIDALLIEHQVRSDKELGPVERTALACVALPTCSQALTEAERQLPEMVDTIESTLSAVGLDGRRLQLRMTGCPNGCARPAVAELGLVGRTKTSYDVIVGGGFKGNRLARTLAEKVKVADVPGLLEPLFIRWREEGLEDEAFGDFVTRIGL